MSADQSTRVPSSTNTSIHDLNDQQFGYPSASSTTQYISEPSNIPPPSVVPAAHDRIPVQSLPRVDVDLRPDLFTSQADVNPGHLYWPDPSIDIYLGSSIEYPTSYTRIDSKLSVFLISFCFFFTLFKAWFHSKNQPLRVPGAQALETMPC